MSTDLNLFSERLTDVLRQVTKDLTERMPSEGDLVLSLNKQQSILINLLLAAGEISQRHEQQMRVLKEHHLCALVFNCPHADEQFAHPIWEREKQYRETMIQCADIMVEQVPARLPSHALAKALVDDLRNFPVAPEPSVPQPPKKCVRTLVIDYRPRITSC